MKPVERTNLADDLVDRVMQMIRTESYQAGDRLPAIMEMARGFGVGHPTLREALKKLEVVGVVEIKHGSGVYVGRGHDALVVSNPVYGGEISKKLLIDLVEARLPLEVRAAALAATQATEAQLDRMAELLEEAARNLDNDAVLSETNMAFHREVAVASGNVVLPQLQEAATNLFSREQRVILGIYGSREKDHAEHVGILEALRAHDAKLAQERMRAHLEGVSAVLLRWDATRNPFS